MVMGRRLGSGGSAILSVTGSCRWRGGDGTNMRFRVPESAVNTAHIPKKINELGAAPRNLHRLTLFAPCPILDARQLVDTMKKVLLATVAILAFAAPSFAAEPAKTVGQAPPSGASAFYLAQDTATMKCQIVETQPAAGGSMKVVGAAHPTKASAETALTADKTCK
jgi:hypothetical protein